MDILSHMLEFQEDRDHIRDEAFCQVVKQICGNSNPESVLRGWELLLIMSSFTPCSVRLAAPLIAWIGSAKARGRAGTATVTDVPRLDVLPKMQQLQIRVKDAMNARDETLVTNELRDRTRAALEKSIVRGTRVHPPVLPELCASLQNI